MRGLAFGDGLDANVQQMYQTLAELYEGEDDRVYLFGFSRGAFTVRALAGLIYRCGLPCPERAKDDRLFERAWQLYVRLRADSDATQEFKENERQRKCFIHFLGLWDTVKSYGGLRPVMLPHLRHNPMVKIVRHAIALDEQRGWFDATTWGRLDIDRRPSGAMSRLTCAERACIMEQDIEEVWFRGCHSDIGGGDKEVRSARIALRWMLGEAANKGLRLNRDGECLLRPPKEREWAEIHDSHSLFWRLVELIPRNEIDNFGEWPKTIPARTRNAPRHPGALLRNGMVSLHESVVTGAPAVSVRRTKPF